MFSLNLSLSLIDGDGRLDVELELINFLIVKFSDSVAGAFWAVCLIVSLIVADEGEWLLEAVLSFLLLDDAADNLTEHSEVLQEVSLGP